MADWQAIKTEYITTDTSYRKLAQKYGVHYKVISNRGKDERWVELRSQHRDKILTKTLDKISTKTADKMARIDDLADQLLDKLQQAITELDMQLYKHTDKTKTIEYNNDRRPDKPTKETIHEEERLLETKSIVDRQGLKQIASALKDIKEVKMLRSDLDRQEQEARIAAWRQKSMTSDGDDDETGVILLAPRMDVGNDG